MENLYVAYYRVSSKEQEASHLGLEAQQETVLNYIRNNGNKLIAEFTETESGKNDKRPELNKALSVCKREQATLVIAKLDRLSRNLTFISQLMDSKVKFVCADMPEATDFTIHIFAALAQQERKYISERTKAALQAKKKREPNWKAGTLENLTDEGRVLAWEVVRRNACEDENTRKAFHFIKPRREGGMTYERIAELLNVEGYYTRTKLLFTRHMVRKIYLRFTEEM